MYEMIDPQVSVLDEEFFKKHTLALISAEPEERQGYCANFTVGCYRFGRPELFMYHRCPEACSEILSAFAELNLTGILKEGLTLLPGKIFPGTGEPMHFGVKVLHGAQFLTASEMISSTYRLIAGGKEFEELYTSGAVQIFTPDESNLLPWEYSPSEKYVSGQVLQPARIH